MAQTAFTGKERIGRITLERFRDSLRLRWTLQGKTFSLTIGKDSRDTLKVARAKAQTIDSDITFEKFDPTLQKYGKSQSTVLEVVSVIQPSAEISLRELWDKYLEDKLPTLKPKSQDEYRKFSKLLDKIKHLLSYNTLETKDALTAITTIDQTRRMLLYLSACCDWGVKHKLITSNPYRGVSADLPKRHSLTNPEPNSFTEEERNRVIEAFKNHKHSGISYSHYASIVEFWFLTGCRPSEAIGLTWGKISEDCSSVTFSGSIQIVNGTQFWSKGSKNNKVRTIAVSPRLQRLLRSIKPKGAKSDQLVFPSPSGKPINYDNFTRRGWNKVVDPIKPNTTPYNCRDTFVTLQLLKGVPGAVIAKWCDTSTGMIDKNYADKLKLSQLRPMD